MKIAVPKERAPGERRVALVPDVVGKLVGAGHTVTVERGAGAAAFYPDAAYEKAGAALADGTAVYAGAESVARVAKPDDAEVAAIPRGAALVGFLAPLGDPRSVERYAAAGLSALGYMRKYGVVEIARDLYRQDERPLTPEELDGTTADEHGVLRKPADDESTPPLMSTRTFMPGPRHGRAGRQPRREWSAMPGRYQPTLTLSRG